ncbi:MAG: AMP-binding protein [Castellaniella sp.]
MQASAHIDTFTRDHLPPRAQWPVFLFDGLPDTTMAPRLNAATALLETDAHRAWRERIAFRWLEEGREHTLSYQALVRLVDRIAHVLVGPMGLVPGNRLLLRGRNSPLMAAAWLAAVKAGLVTVPTMPMLRRSELRIIMDKARVQAALCETSLLGELQAACAVPGQSDIPPGGILGFGGAADEGLEALLPAMPATFSACDTAGDDVCLIAFTSGTTGEPKACLHFHRDILAMCDTFGRHVLRLVPDDIVIGTPPLAFTFGLGGLLCFPLHAGASTALVGHEGPEVLMAQIRTLGVTTLFGPPTLYRQMAANMPEGGLPSLRLCVSAGEALPDATRRLWKQASGIEMLDGIGGTEMMHIYIASAPDAVRRGAIGRVVPGYEARVVDAQMQSVPPGTVGRLAVRGPTGCRYLADARQTEYVQQGWNLTGDRLFCDEDGYFHYQARNDDIIVSAGYSIAAPEVEDALLSHEAVAECAVVGRPHPLRGTIVHAFVVLHPGWTPGSEMALQLQAHARRCVAPYKYPRAITFVDRLPRSPTGKLQRFALRDADNPNRPG